MKNKGGKERWLEPVEKEFELSIYRVEPVEKEFKLSFYDRVRVRKNMGIEIEVLENPQQEAKKVKVWLRLEEVELLRNILNQEMGEKKE